PGARSRGALRALDPRSRRPRPTAPKRSRRAVPYRGAPALANRGVRRCAPRGAWLGTQAEMRRERNGGPRRERASVGSEWGRVSYAVVQLRTTDERGAAHGPRRPRVRDRLRMRASRRAGHPRRPSGDGGGHAADGDGAGGADGPAHGDAAGLDRRAPARPSRHLDERQPRHRERGRQRARDGSGLVTGKASGAATITSTSEGQRGTAEVTVTARPPGRGEVLVGAGDIADCGSSGAEATAALLDAIPGTVFTAGDNVYSSGTASEYANCYDPTWGRHKARTRPAPGNHEYNTSDA